MPRRQKNLKPEIAPLSEDDASPQLPPNFPLNNKNPEFG
jgi:hypothetical protein